MTHRKFEELKGAMARAEVEMVKARQLVRSIETEYRAELDPVQVHRMRAKFNELPNTREVLREVRDYLERGGSKQRVLNRVLETLAELA